MRHIFFWLIISSILVSCSEKENLTAFKEIESLSDSSQFFTFTNDNIARLETRNGAKLLIEPNTFELNDGTSPTGAIQLEVREVYEKSDMILNGLTTTSDGRLLESFGMLFINATSGGKVLKIKDGRSIAIAIPNKQEGFAGELFYGEKTDSVLNWQYAGTTQDTTEVVETLISRSTDFIETRDSIKSTTYQYVNGLRELVSDTTFAIEGDYTFGIWTDSAIAMPPTAYEFQIENLGWINCDRFVEVEEKVNLEIKLKQYGEPVGYLVFTSINSVMGVYFDENGEALLGNLPMDYDVDLIVIDKIKGNMMWVKKALKIRSDNKIVLETSKISKEEVKAELKALDKSK